VSELQVGGHDFQDFEIESLNQEPLKAVQSKVDLKKDREMVITNDNRQLPSGRYRNPTGPGDYDLPQIF